MELLIKQIPEREPIGWNYEDIKAWALEQKHFFETVVYTDGDIKQAKEDRADLNRMAKAIGQRRIEITKEWNRPLEQFVGEAKEVEAILADAAKMVDKPIKEYEERKKEEKAAEIRQAFDDMNNLDWLTVEAIWNPKWTNAGTSMKSIRLEIGDALTKIGGDLATLSMLQEFSFEATEIYKKTLDIGEAINEGQRLADIQRRKEEAERAQNAQNAENKAEPAEYMNKPVETEEQPEQAAQEQDQACWVNFSAFLTADQALSLKDFFVTRGIAFRRI